MSTSSHLVQASLSGGGPATAEPTTLASAQWCNVLMTSAQKTAESTANTEVVPARNGAIPVLTAAE